MKYALNDELKYVSAEEISQGSHRSMKYTCPECFSRVFYVSCSERSVCHFKHESNCTSGEVSNHTNYENRMSAFHKNWQDIFPCVEFRIENNIADIFISSENEFNLFDDDNNQIFKEFNPKSLVIEIQNSYISYQTLFKRQTVYKTSERELLWIFNLQKADIIIERIITYAMDKYIIKFIDGDFSFMNLMNMDSSAYILLDTGSNRLYSIVNKPIQEEYYEVSIIKRKSLLEQLSSILNHQLEWKMEVCRDIVNVYNYEELYEIIKDEPIQIESIRECFHLMESINFKYFMEDCEGFVLVGETLSKLSNKNENVMYTWIEWVMKNKPDFNDRMSHGKWEGKMLNEIDVKYLMWINDNFNCKNELERRISALLLFDVEVLEKRFINSF